MNHFWSLDTESTALPHEGGSVVEICFLEVKDWQIVNRFYSMINPHQEMTAGAFNANRIKVEEYENAPSFKQLEPEISRILCSGIPIIGYNIIRCDMLLLKNDYQRIGKDCPNEKSDGIEIFDVWKLANKLLSKEEAERKTGSSSRSQQNVAKYFGIDTRGSHRAESDAAILIEIYKKLLEAQEQQPEKETKTKKKNIINAEPVLPVLPKFTVVVPETQETKTQETKTTQEITTTDKIHVSESQKQLFSGLLKIKPELVVAASIIKVKKLSSHLERINKAIEYVISDKETANHAASEINWLRITKTEIAEARKLAIAPVKKLVTSLEAMFRELLNKPVDNAITTLTERRSEFLTKQNETKKETAIQTNQDAENTAVFLAELALKEAKKTMPLEAAIIVSEQVYEESLADLNKNQNKLERPEKTRISIGTVTDNIVYDIDIINASQVPNKWLIPDENAITEYVNQTKGEVKIPGVMIFSKVESKFRKI